MRNISIASRNLIMSLPLFRFPAFRLRHTPRDEPKDKPQYREENTSLNVGSLKASGSALFPSFLFSPSSYLFLSFSLPWKSRFSFRASPENSGRIAPIRTIREERVAAGRAPSSKCSKFPAVGRLWHSGLHCRTVAGARADGDRRVRQIALYGVEIPRRIDRAGLQFMPIGAQNYDVRATLRVSRDKWHSWGFARVRTRAIRARENRVARREGDDGRPTGR